MTNNTPFVVSPLLRVFDASGVIEEMSPSYDDTDFSFAGGSWRGSWNATESEAGRTRHVVRAELVGGSCESVSLALEVSLYGWSPPHYLLVPGVIYDGNRFRVDAQSYPPIFHKPYNEGPETPPVITDVLRLNIEPGPSRFSMLAGALTVPVVGIFDPLRQTSLLVLTQPFAGGRETGYEFEESEDRKSARLLISSPGVRLPFRYAMCNSRTPSEDRGASLAVGEFLEVVIETVTGACEEIPALFDQVFRHRGALAAEPKLAHGLPFSAAWEILEEKYNRDNWIAGDGYYAVGVGTNRNDDYQIGWVGGLMNTLPLLQDGSADSRERAWRAIDFVFAKGGQGASGFFHGMYHKGEWSGDGFDENQFTPQARPHPERNHYHLLRKSADALYFLLRQFDFLKPQGLPSTWRAGTRACANAFVKLWQENRQLGQFVDIHTGQIIAGGTSSAGIAPAGLSLAARFFDEPAYLQAAVEIADYFEKTFTDRGLTTGGPGEILQTPDSESAAGLLESYVVLWEETGDARWLAAAEKAAVQCATWVMSYDYSFPPESCFGKLGMHSAGAVFANSQNGHGAPGYCTLSGDSLLKLYRATGRLDYLELLRSTAHNLTQYLSRRDRPVFDNLGRDLPSGWMNERVNTGDWDDNLGGVFYGSNWCELALLLTFAQVPGVYVRSDTGEICIFDHVEVKPVYSDGDFTGLRFHNPTKFLARVKILVEDTVSSKIPLGTNGLLHCPMVTVPAGGNLLCQLDQLANFPASPKSLRPLSH